MASDDQLETFHLNLLGVGSGAAALSVGSLIAYAARRPTLHRAIPATLLVCSLMLLVVGVGVWGNEKQRPGPDAAALTHQARIQNHLPEIPEATLVALAGALVALVSLMVLAWQYQKLGAVRYWAVLTAWLGWVLLAVGCSTYTQSLSTIDPHRVAWTLTGSLFIVASCALIPWEERSSKFSAVGLVGPLHGLGWALFLVGYSHASRFST